MVLNIKVHTNSSRQEIKKLVGGYNVWLKSKALEGRANFELLKMLKKEFGKNFKIIKGFKSRDKVVDVC